MGAEFFEKHHQMKFSDWMDGLLRQKAARNDGHRSLAWIASLESARNDGDRKSGMDCFAEKHSRRR
jgi:hypothetical protein